jgi:hypothetical protein
MRIRMTTLRAGPAGVWPVGSVQDCPPAEARALIDGGYAVAVERAPDPAAEKAAAEKAAAEKAAAEHTAAEQAAAEQTPAGRRGKGNAK